MFYNRIYTVFLEIINDLYDLFQGHMYIYIYIYIYINKQRINEDIYIYITYGLLWGHGCIN